MTNNLNNVIVNVNTINVSVNKYVITNSRNGITRSSKEECDINVVDSANFNDDNTTKNKVINEEDPKKTRDKIFKGIKLIIKIVYYTFLFYEISMQILNRIQ